MLLRGDRSAPSRSEPRGAVAPRGRPGRPTCWRSCCTTTMCSPVARRSAARSRSGRPSCWLLTREHGFAHWHATATLLHGWAMAQRGALDEGLETDAGRARRQAGHRLAAEAALLSGPHGRSARPRRARGSRRCRCWTRPSARSRRPASAGSRPSCTGSAARSCSASHPTVRARARTASRRAAEVARSQQAAWWEARVARSLASAARAA